jgi:hypothetical protein
MDTSGSRRLPESPEGSTAAKRPWVTPTLTVHGDIQQITKGTGTKGAETPLGSIVL